MTGFCSSKILNFFCLAMFAILAFSAAAAESEISQMISSLQVPANSASAIGPSDMLPSEQGILGPIALSAGFDDLAYLEKQIAYFQGLEGISWLNDGISHAEPFRDFILAYLSANKLPPELYFVVMVESSFRVNAVSRSGAAGLWQFMMNSIGGAMHHNEWMDERYDFWSSTKAALEKLRDNFEQFGDWPLALAAYNAGSGRIDRLLKKTGAKTFWELSKSSLMPLETRQYVPRILAAAYVGSHPGRFGLPISWNRIVEWDKVEVRTAIPIRKLEETARIPAGILVLGNSELRFDITPPGVSSHFIKVPHQYTQALIAALNSDAIHLDYSLHIILKGDTLFAIGKRYGTNAKLILEYNPGLSPNHLRIGQKLIIPLLPVTVSAEKPNMDTVS